MSKSILVTGVGGVVGQGILRNIRADFPDIRLIGTNTIFVSAGNHLCDQVYEVPFGDDELYVQEISKIVQEELVDLIIPSTDMEAFYLGRNSNKLQTLVAISPPDVTGLSLDKWATYQRFDSAGIPFAKSALPSQYNGEFDQVIVKPRTGRGSRDIYIHPSSPTNFSDDFVVQEYLEGTEITTTFYVNMNREVHGHITFKRELDSGNTSMAEVVFDFDDEVTDIIHQLVRAFDCRGSINIQSKVTKEGVIPFEINSRISGTNSLRPHFGFHDVKYTVQEWLYNQEPDAVQVTSGCALRIISDIIYPHIHLSEIKNIHDNFKRS